ncbi:hypothetical protein [Pseudonocardia yunnanensis]|uniref:Uncharacterized protein n=1 Tax=Pseudonocardia yunnanensis TaxID=58107 RepID=A0ABW4F3T5_9PSEU
MTRQKSVMPTQARRTATPWIADQSHGFACAAGWLKINVGCHAEPIP